jgi:glycosyltransferase involved in cell wall biosynthesis
MSLPEKKIKILHIVDLSKTGGVEVMFMDFLSRIIVLRPDFEHAVFALRINKAREKELLSLGVKVYSPKNNSYNLLRRLKVIRHIATEHYDIVHGQNYSGNLWAAIGTFFQTKPVNLISHEHGGSWGAEGVHKILSQFWARASTLIICNSKAAEQIIRQKIYKKANLKLIYNGVRRSDFTGYRDLTTQEFNILFVGRLEEVKGVRELVSALKILQDLDVQFRCNILGEGRMRKWLMEYLEQHDLFQKVILHGVVNNVDHFMDTSDILVLPSLREPLGNVIIEAAHRNLPVIASNVDGIKEIVVHNSTGILLSPKLACATRGLPKHVIGEFGELTLPMAIDPNELAEELIKLKNNPDLRKKYGLSANKLLKDFTIDCYTEQISQTYMEL